MKEELRFNWLDVFRAPRMALSLQKIWVLFPPLLVGYILYLAFTYLGLAAAGGNTLKKVLQETHGLMPCVVGVEGLNVGSYVLWAVGVVLLAVCFLFGATAVARAAFLELKGETFFTYRELYAFAKKHAKDTILGPIGILAVIVGIVICGLILGLFGRIPYVGIIPVVLFSPIWWGICFFLVALCIVFLFSLLLAPGITASTKGDFFEVITETFSASFSEPYRLVWYEVVLGVIGALATAILGFFVMLAYKIMVGILTLGMGGSFKNVADSAWLKVQHWFPVFFSHITEKSVDLSGYEAFWAYVLAVVAAIAGFTVIGCYGGAVLSAGNTLIYVVLHKIKDEEDLLELEEEEEEEKEPAKEEEKPEEKKPEEEQKEKEEVKAEETPEKGESKDQEEGKEGSQGSQTQ